MGSEQRRTVRTVTTTRTTYGASGNRSALGYWIPLALTVTAATVGLAAWIWSEKEDSEDSSESEAEHYYATGTRPPGRPNEGGLGGAAAAAGAAGLGAAAGYSSMSGGLPPGPGPAGQQPPPPGSFQPQPPAQGGFQGPPPEQMPPPGGEAAGYFRDDQSRAMSTGVTTSQEDQGFMARMSNAVGLTRADTPVRSNNTGGGWATSARTMVEGAVNAVRGTGEGDQHFSDQEKWSEEADKPERSHSMSPRKSTGSLGGAVIGAAAGAGAVAASRSLQRQGTAQEFYSGAVEAPRRSSVSSRKRRTVAVVVSSVEKGTDGLEVDAHQSILAHLPEYLNTETTRIIVLIYSPNLHTHPLSAISRRAAERQQSAASERSQSTSSYAKINTPGANGTPSQTPGDFPMEAQNEDSQDKGILAHVDPQPMESNSSLPHHGPRDELERNLGRRASRSKDGKDDNTLERQITNPLDEEANSLFKTLYNQANALVDRDTSILPFTSREGHKHILRSIQPEIVYIQESLCGTDGSLVSELQGWVRQTVVVIGDEGGFGGLIDSDTEDEQGARKRGEGGGASGKWWSKESVTGVGRGVSVVESLHVGEDWRRRVNDEE